MPNTDDPAALHEKLVQLKLEHRDLDLAIRKLSEDKSIDQLQVRRLKKRKLQIKDYIAKLESRLIPDIDA